MEQNIIDDEDYKFKVKKTWVERGKVWHIQFFTLGVLENRFECFLTTEQLNELKDIL